MARLLRIPLVIQEQNAIPGFTNRILARVANRVFEAFPGSFPAAVGAQASGRGMLTLGGSLSGFTGPVTLDQGILNVNNAENATVANVLSGAGTFRKSGAGRLFLSGDSSGFTGSTQVQEGALAVNGSLGGNVAVEEHRAEERGLRLDPDRTDLYNLKGFCHFKLREHEAAIESFKAVLRINPGSAIDYANIASNYRDMGKLRKAAEYYGLALAIDPGIEFARQNLERLKEMQDPADRSD